MFPVMRQEHDVSAILIDYSFSFLFPFFFLFLFGKRHRVSALCRLLLYIKRCEWSLFSQEILSQNFYFL